MSEWHRRKVCKGCFWLRQIDSKTDGRDGKCCAYTYYTDRFRQTPVREDFCGCYCKRKGAEKQQWN